MPGFGGTDTIEYLDQALYKLPYFNKFVKYFEGLGYTKGKDLNGAPFDWRFAPGIGNLKLPCTNMHSHCMHMHLTTELIFSSPP